MPALPYVIPRLPFSLGVPGIASIPIGDITPIGPNQPPTPEADAWEHWFLHTSDATLTGLVNGRVLTQQAPGHTWTSDGVYIPSRGKALVSGFADAEVQTVWAVVKRYDIATFIGAVTHFGTTTQTADGGSAFGTSNSAAPANMLGTIRATPTGISRTVTWPSAVAVGDWAFIALSERFDGANRQYCVYIGGAPTAQNAVITAASDKLVIGRNVALGSAYSATAAEGTGIGVTACEFGIKAAALTQVELDALYLRSKQNHLRSGLVVK